MREFFIRLFRDDTFGPKMGLYNLTHIIVLLLVCGAIVFMALKFYNKDEKIKNKILNILIITVVCLYFGDFFVHPLMNNENALIVDKLPFHLCTSACILIGATRNWRSKFERLYPTLVVLGLVGSFLYIIVPTGVDECYLFCYRSLQTLIYHSLLFMFGVLSIVYGDIKLSFKKIYFAAIIIAIQIIISLFANTIYSTEDHHYDWYFSTGSSFGINQYLMPFITFAAIFGTTCIVYGIVYLVNYIINKKKAIKE